MKPYVLIIFMLVPVFLSAQISYNSFFENSSLRFDFLLGGSSDTVIVYPQQIKKEPSWAGSRTNVISPFNYGTYRFQVFDLMSNRLIFKKGFSTLFQEWQATDEAKQEKKTFYQAAIFPFPKNSVRLEIDARKRDGNFKTIYKTEINPNDYFILNEALPSFEVVNILSNGKPEEKVDLVILAEGYTLKERDKFIEDAKRVSGYLFSYEPFLSGMNKFNVKAVFSVSVESGTDIPGDNIYKNTCFNSTFYTFDVARYLTTSDMKTIYDVAATVPYDHIYVLTNTEKYGGGGFYNLLSICSADNALTKEVFVHEFGHSFAGLGDEYYSSSVAYQDFYNLEVEPWEPNLTTLVDFGEKWESMIDVATPIPTPREDKFKETIGVFEGGGYSSKGIYSPYIDCRMKSNQAKKFCPVCEESIWKVIQFYSE